MRMVEELRHMVLYSAKNKFYAPVNKSDKRHGSALLLLTPNMESSVAMTKLEAMYNPELFTSFYIDRNVTAYINSTNSADIVKDFDQEEAEQISEAMNNIFKNPSTEFRFDDNVSIIAKKNIEGVFNKGNATKCMKKIKIDKLPKTIKVVVHPSVSSLRNEAPSFISNIFNDSLYSFTNKNTIHVINKSVYDEQCMGGTYGIYLLTELYYAIIFNINKDIHPICIKGIASSLSGQNEWIRNKENNSNLRLNDSNKFAKIVSIMIKDGKYDTIRDFIKTGDLGLFKDEYAKTSIINHLKILSRILFEADMSYAEREKLMPSEFGIPEKRKYPIHDRDHVRAAVRMFNHCDKDDEAKLAAALIKAIKKFGMEDEISVGDKNRFSKYYTSKKAINESFSYNICDDNPAEEDKFAMVTSICNSLSKEEMSKISLYDEYRDSKFVIKRIIHKVDYTPAGFLDVYLFPSNPEVAMITIATDSRFRGMGVGDALVNELMESNLHEEYKFNVYLWTAHEENEASQNLAKKHGFIDTNTYDKLGRKRFVKLVKQIEQEMDLKEINKSVYHKGNDSVLVTESMAMIFEADNPTYSDRLKRYLYKERIRNNRAVLDLYERVRILNPDLKKMYYKLELYRSFNIFVDLSYYHSIFMSNNNFRLVTAMDYYVEFLDRLLNNTEISNIYNKQTILIPVEHRLWAKTPDSDITDFRDGLNPISLIVRLIRTNLSGLRKAFRNKEVLFVGAKGYFKVNFDMLEVANIPKFKMNIMRLTRNEEIIEDDKEITSGDKDTSEAMAAKMISKIERNTSINIDNINTRSKTSIDSSHNHLSVTSNSINIGSDDTVLISVDPDGAEGFISQQDKDSILKNLDHLAVYYNI